jgi:hypothetical protein
MKLRNLKGELLSRLQPGNTPTDVAVTQDGDLVFINYSNKTVKLVRNRIIHASITLKGWGPQNVFSASSGDLLVSAISDDLGQSKVTRFSGTTEKYSIKYDDNGKSLYSTESNTKHISEYLNG